MTIKEAAQTALDVQDACNLSGVVHSFSQAMHAVFEEAERLHKGTDWRNAHPIVTLYLSKLCSLNRGYYECDYLHASDACEAIIRGETVEYIHQGVQS